MFTLRRAGDRGHFDHGWLNTWHTFSFGRYFDRDQMGFRALRVMNEDFVQPGKGFGEHPHDNMEIVTYVLSGELEHRDSLGNGEVLRPGEFQRMTAGTGIRHSEFNPSPAHPVHLYQIWLLPESEGLRPSYEQKAFPLSERQNRLRLVASPDGENGSLTIHQDVRIFLGTFAPGQSFTCALEEGRYAWLQVLTGRSLVETHELAAGDGLAAERERQLTMTAVEPTEVLLFDLS